VTMGSFEARLAEHSDLPNKSVLGWGNRGWLEIIDLMLEVCERGALKTHVMYKCNLNSKQLQQYMDFMLSRNLVAMSEEGGDVRRTVFVTTERGRKLMAAYSELADIFAIKERGLEK
jgi:predicted transcriptional regulator